MGVEFELIIDSEKFKTREGPKINYSDLKIGENEFHVQNHALLFEQDIKSQAVKCFTVNNNQAFFKSENRDFPFDIFAASFYLLSRYEEYLPHEKDMYGRYAHENSLAHREGFMNLPLINIWVKHLAEKLKALFPTFNFQLSTFNFVPTYDIDMAYSYKHKGLWRNIGGFLKSPSVERIQVLTGAVNDPFDCYGWLNQLHDHFHLQPVYFFLVATKNGVYDKNILPHKNAMWKLIKLHAKKYKVGLHPSWQSGNDRSLLKKEKEQLTAMMHAVENVPVPNRQHYIRFNLPQDYQRLIAAGITDDYSMGYGSINGFRASVASSFYWYDLEKEQQTPLRIHPFCFMDANSFYEQRQSPQQTVEELMHYLLVCKETNSTLITIWHNDFLGTAKKFEGWKSVYEKFITQVQQ
jgi:hypothetical protein